MSGNYHVRFYGEEVGLTRPPYPRGRDSLGDSNHLSLVQCDKMQLTQLTSVPYSVRVK